MNETPIFSIHHAMVIVIAIIIYFYGFENEIFQKVSKESLIKKYKVDKKTFNKWIRHFGTEVYPDFSDWLSKRKLYQYECLVLEEILGNPTDFPVLDKQQIIEKSEGSYRSLRECIYRFPDSFQIEATAYHNLRKFPPAISKNILEKYG